MVVPPAEAWKATLPDAALPPVVTDGKHVFATTRAGDLRAFDVAAGTLTWGGGGRRGVLAAGAGLVVVHAPGGNVSALDADTGTPRWNSDTPVKGALPALVTSDIVFV